MSHKHPWPLPPGGSSNFPFPAKWDDPQCLQTLPSDGKSLPWLRTIALGEKGRRYPHFTDEETGQEESLKATERVIQSPGSRDPGRGGLPAAWGGRTHRAVRRRDLQELGRHPAFCARDARAEAEAAAAGGQLLAEAEV